VATDAIRSVAVIGTGTMGAPMARNLAAAGLEVSAWNRSREKAEPLTDHGIEVAATATDAAAGADAVLTVLTSGDAVEQVMGGGVLEAMQDGAVWIQASTIGVAAAERMRESAGSAGVPLVDAPVLGTKQPAEQGALVVLASGPPEQEERCAPVFDAVGSRTLWLGEAGAGSRMKVIVNSWLTALVTALAETIALARSLGEDPRRFLEVIEGGPLGLPYAELKGSAMIDHQYPPSFSLHLAEKDVGLVLEAAEQAGLRLELTEAVRSRFARAAELGHGEEDMAAVVEAYG
jgi:3-hydroxyisobutyrate dehydrogenase